MAKNPGDTSNYNRISGLFHFKPQGESGKIDFGNITLHSVDPGTEEKEHFKTVRGVKMMDRRDTIQVKPIYNIEGDEYHKLNIPILLFGEKTGTETQAVGSAVTVTLEAVKLGMTYSLGKVGTTVTSVKVDTADKVKGTDYVLDEGTGNILILDGGSIADGDDVVVTFDHVAVTRTLYKSFSKTRSSGTGYLYELDDKSIPLRTREFPCDITVDKQGEFKPDDFSTWTLKVAVTGDEIVKGRD